MVEKKEIVHADETLDDLLLGGMQLIQPKRGYRFSLDAVLLANFPDLSGVKQVVDLGTGNGIIPCLLLARSSELQIIGVEKQPEMVERANRSMVYNQLQDQVEIIAGDVRAIENYLPRGSAELVLSNPPFWKKGEGRLNKHPETAIARHEIDLNLGDVVAKSTYLLQPGGRLAIIHRAQRLPEALSLFQSHRILPSKLRLVYPKADREANLMLLEGCKERMGQLRIMPPLIVYDEQGQYSMEIKSYYRSAE